MNKSLLYLLYALPLVFACSSNESLTDDFLLNHSNLVTADSIKAHIAYLADDQLKGRLPGTPEYALTMNYVANQFKALGLKPKGDEGRGYYQDLTIRKGLVDEGQSFMTYESDTLIHGEDYVYIANLNEAETIFEGDLIFAGYGIEAPEFNYNDYANLQVEGKIVVVLTGSNNDFPSSERAFYSDFVTKFNTASQKGAVGVLFVNPNGEINYISGIYDRFQKRGNTGVLIAENQVIGRRVYNNKLNFAAFCSKQFIEQAFKQPMDSLLLNYNQEVNAKITGKLVSHYEDIQSSNVVGLLEGEELKNEYIVHTAHLDHVGIGAPVDNDSIYNGAHDNASGTSSMIEIARLYTQLENKPKRSVLFIALTAEEMGLLGSAYYARNPTVPKSGIIANINTDMPTLIAPLLSIEPLGAEHSSLMKEVQHAAGLLNLDIMEDHMPEQVRFVRSDQYNFILQGIPSLHIKYGLKSATSETGLKELIDDYTKNVYHKPNDELNDLFDFEAGRTYVRLQFLISYFINRENEKPQWNAGDFFEKY